MGTHTNDLRVDISVNEREAERRVRAFNKAQESVGETAQRASQRARSAGQARNAVEKEFEGQLKRLERGLGSAERRMVTFGLRGVEKIRAQRDEMLRLARATGATEQTISRITTAYGRMERQLERTRRQQERSRGLFSGGGGVGAALGGARGALAAVGVVVGAREIAQFTTEAVQAAARAEELGRTLDVMSERFNVSRHAMSETERALRGMRLTATQARDAIQLFTRAGASQAEIVKLVEVTFDAAARRGRTFEDALRRVADGIAKAEPELLDELGIYLKLSEAFRDYAKQVGAANALQLTQAQRSRALAEAVAATSATGGEFAATVGTMSRAMRDASLETSNLTENLGRVFSNSAKGLVTGYTDALRSLNTVLEENARREEAIEAVRQRRLSRADPRLAREIIASGTGAPAADDPEVLEEVMRRLTQQRLRGLLDPKNLTGRGVRGVAGAPGAEAGAGGIDPKIQQAVERTRSLLESAQLSEVEGVERILAQRRLYLAELGKTHEAIQNINRATEIQIGLELRAVEEARNRLFAASPVRAGVLEGEGQGLSDFNAQMRQRLEISDRIAGELQQHERRRLDESRDLEIARLEAAGADTVEQKLAVEQRKLQIEIEFLRRSSALNEAKIQQDIAKEIAANQGMAEQLYNLQARLFEESFLARESAIARATESTAARQSEIIRSSNQRVFDDLQRQAEGVLDILFQRTGSFAERIARVFEATVLTGFKNVAAAGIASLLSGGGSAGGSAGGGGGGGRLAGLFSGFGLFGGGIGRPGAPGGTVGFAGPVASVGRTVAGGGLAGAGLGGGLAGLKALFGVGTASAGAVGGGFGLGGFGLSGTSLSSVLRSPAASIGGLALAALSIKKGGLTGIIGGAAGGGLAGFSFGGPVGAAIGAAIGGVAGAIRTLFDSAKEKAQKKIKAFYGVDIRNKGTLEQIVAIAKQAYGGNLDLAIASPQVRDLVELYSMAYGQQSSAFGLGIASARLVQRGGQVFQEAQYSFGRPYLLPSNLPVSGLAANQQVNVIHLTIDGKSTERYFRGETVTAIENNPRLVQSAARSAQRGSYDRRETAVRILEPGTLLA